VILTDIVFRFRSGWEILVSLPESVMTAIAALSGLELTVVMDGEIF
jgi:hypothetical protein